MFRSTVAATTHVVDVRTYPRHLSRAETEVGVSRRRPTPGKSRSSSQAASARRGKAPEPGKLTGKFAPWLESTGHPTCANVTILTERDGVRAAAIPMICDAVEDQILGTNVLARMGMKRAAAVAEQRLPKGKRIRSGDLAEVLATEYVNQETEFDVPLKRLRHKDDREMSMRGDDIIGIRKAGRGPVVLKGEVKSRAELASSVVKEACDALDSSHGRPKPQTLGFVAHQLRQLNRDRDAERVEDLMQQKLGVRDVTHLVFTMSGNDPSTHLAAHAGGRLRIADRRLVGLRVEAHQAFIEQVFTQLARRYTPKARGKRTAGAREQRPAPVRVPADAPVPRVAVNRPRKNAAID